MWGRWHEGRTRCRMEKCMETLWCPKCLVFYDFFCFLLMCTCVACAFVRSWVGACVKARAREFFYLGVADAAILRLPVRTPAHLLGNLLRSGCHPGLTLWDASLHRPAWTRAVTQMRPLGRFPSPFRFPPIALDDERNPRWGVAEKEYLTGCWCRRPHREEGGHCWVPDLHLGTPAPRAETVMAFDSVWDIQHSGRQLSGRLIGEWREKRQCRNRVHVTEGGWGRGEIRRVMEEGEIRPAMLKGGLGGDCSALWELATVFGKKQTLIVCSKSILLLLNTTFLEFVHHGCTRINGHVTTVLIRWSKNCILSFG